MHNMSIRCCSATLFSLFTFLCSAVKIFLFSNSTCPHCLLISSKASFAIPEEFVEGLPSLGGIAKYSSSSRRTMIACLVRRGLF